MNYTGIRYLKVSLICLKLLGLWPLEMTGKYSFLNYIHGVYRKLVMGFFLSMHISQYIECYTLLGEGLYAETTSVLGVLLLYVVDFMKIRTIYRIESIGLVQRVREIEGDFIYSKYDEVKTLYKKSVSWNYFVALYMFIGGYFTIIPYLADPIYIEYVNPPVNFTRIVNDVTVYNRRPLPLDFFLPSFIKYKYYDMSYALSTMYLVIGAGVTTACDGFLYAYFMFTVLQLKVIQHKFMHMKEYAADIKFKQPHLTNEEAVRMHLRHCIETHQTLIIFVTDLDVRIEWAMFCDFLVASMRLAMVGFQIMAGVSGLMQVSAIEYVLIMCQELFFYYWNANEIILESENVGNAVWSSEWYDFSIRTQLDLFIVLMRCQKPIIIHCGPIYAMSTQTLTAVFKGSYSYVMLLIRSK